MARFTGYLCALGALALAAACGGDDHNIVLPGADSGPEFDAGPEPDAGDVGDGGSTPDAPVDVAGPTVTLITPTAPAPGDYSSEAIITAGRFTALCEVTRNVDSDTPIDSGSVILSAASGGQSITVNAAPTGAADQYTATLDVSSFANGALDVRCTASDLADEPHTNSATVASFLDLGPRIDVFSPVAGQSYGQQLDITFTVTAQPVADDDDGAEVSTVTVTAAGVDIPVSATGGGSYFATMIFNAPEFSPPLDGEVELVVTAANARTSLAVARAANRVFVADTDGPVIAISAPLAGAVVGGFLPISASIDDSAGVATVLARVAHQYELVLEEDGNGKYSGTFDTRVLPSTYVFPLIEVIALDAVGNESGIGRVVTLDNRPPLISLDPPLMREASCLLLEGCSLDNDDPMECSIAFDPVGSDAADDGETVAQLFELRARLEDQGNGPLTPPEGIIIPHAGIDPTAIVIYVLDDSDGSLLVDLDGDGVCDDINPEISPTSFPTEANEAAVVSLTALSPTGGAYFASDIGAIGEDPFIDDGGCQAAATDEVPEALCLPAASATRIVEGPGQADSIFTMAPVTEDSCMGNAFDAAATNIVDGWACIAARGQDLLGNARISAPLRVCIDSDGDGTDGVDGGGTPLDAFGCDPSIGGVAEEGNRPFCTDGCVPADSFQAFPTRQLHFVD